MLQQTQVETVVPYFRRFLRALPSVRRLARAPLERVLELWSGLGYYRRARNLHAAAKVLLRDFRGRFPQNYAEARSLPGVGDYTARAVLSIAMNRPFFVLDGNVARVVARLEALRGNLHQRGFRQAVESRLDAMLSKTRPGDFNQALMELGQTVCLPRAPRCSCCPLHALCRTLREGNPETYPEPRPRRAVECRHLAVGVLRDGAKLAVVRGLDDGLLGDLWNFPAAFGRTPAEARRKLRARLRSLTGNHTTLGPAIARLRHGITFRDIHVHVFPARLNADCDGDGLRWIPARRLSRAAVSQVTRRIAAEL
jgi:A/G-specific adenine glycosylase